LLFAFWFLAFNSWLIAGAAANGKCKSLVPFLFCVLRRSLCLAAYLQLLRGTRTRTCSKQRPIASGIELHCWLLLLAPVWPLYCWRPAWPRLPRRPRRPCPRPCTCSTSPPTSRFHHTQRLLLQLPLADVLLEKRLYPGWRIGSNRLPRPPAWPRPRHKARGKEVLAGL
jgi:hypothetical protein